VDERFRSDVFKPAVRRPQPKKQWIVQKTGKWVAIPRILLSADMTGRCEWNDIAPHVFDFSADSVQLS